ncbi:MAG: DUF1700 domain-containing protein [Oscillospiraceae bacterium]|nr:DUF1700 domain-containing protein [Oscillospiraceae bacterium]
MTAAEFLQQLEAQLRSLSDEERDSAMAYYREYLEEAGEDADTAAEALGSPQSVAQRIIAETAETDEDSISAPSYQYNNIPIPPKKRGVTAGSITFTIIIAVLTSPFWMTVVILWLSLLLTLFALVASLAFAAIGSPIQGIGSFIDGYIGSGFWEVGSGIFSLGLALLLWLPCWKLAVVSTKGMWRLGKTCLYGLLGKEC